MKKALYFFLICLLTFAFTAAAFASTVEINLAAGEQYVIPESRRGACTVDDESVVRVSGYTVTALRPGRALVHISGNVTTDLIVLVLFSGGESASESLPQAAEPAVSETTAAPLPSPSPAPVQAEDGEPEIFIRLPEESPAAPTAVPAATPEPIATQAPAETPAPSIFPDDGPAFQHYDHSAVPDLINGAIDLAFTQWEEDAEQGTKKFSRLGKYNKYSYWQCGSGSGCDIGWCGAFLGYVFDNAGVPMDKPTDSVPHEGGIPYSVRAAGVGKIYTGFSNMERLSMIPRPGYFVVYGQQKGYAYKHIGLVVDADDLGDGRYLIKTIEGNMSSTIRRYCYLYDSNEAVKNLQPCPEEYVRDDAGINAYEHVKNWNITTFCQTWLPAGD